MRTGGVSRASLHLTVLYTSPPYQVVSFPASSLVTLLSFSGGSTSFDLSVRQNNINIDAAAHANIKKVGLGRAAQQGAGTEQSPSAGYFPLVMVPSRPAESN